METSRPEEMTDGQLLQVARDTERERILFGEDAEPEAHARWERVMAEIRRRSLHAAL